MMWYTAGSFKGRVMLCARACDQKRDPRRNLQPRGAEQIYSPSVIFTAVYWNRMKLPRMLVNSVALMSSAATAMM